MLVNTSHFLNGPNLSEISAPLILTNRSDSIDTRVNSIALASNLSEHIKKIKHKKTKFYCR